MKKNYQNLTEEYFKVSLAIEEYLPGYVDAYYGPREWQAQANQDGKLPFRDLSERTARLAYDISQADDMDRQRKDFFARQVTAMQMSLRLLAGEKVSLVEEVQCLYDVQPEWADESRYEEAYKELDQLLPPGSSLSERKQEWDRSLEIPLEKAKELLPFVTKRLQDVTRQKFGLPEQESFDYEWVYDKAWSANNLYLGDFRSAIQINGDLPMRINGLAGLMAHEGYPGHHTELAIKEQKLIRQKGYDEHKIVLINSPSCLVAEGIATSALETALTNEEQEVWYREEILPRAGMSHVDPARMLQIDRASEKVKGLMGNVAFMFYDQHKSAEEAEAYLRRYALVTEKVIKRFIRFVSEPSSRSYVFNYDIGYDLLQELFAVKDRDAYFKRILEEPVTPSQIRQWIADAK